MSKWHEATHSKLLSGLSEVIEQFDGQRKEALKGVLRRENGHGAQTKATVAEAEMFKQLIAEFGIKGEYYTEEVWRDCEASKPERRVRSHV